MDLIQLQSLAADVFSVNGARTTYARKSAVPAQSQNVASMSPVGFGNLSRTMPSKQNVQNPCLNCFMYQNPSWIKFRGTESQERVKLLYLIVKVSGK